MKRFLKAYISFTRTERMGMLALFIIISVLLTIRLTMSYWAKPTSTPQKKQELTTAWNNYKQNEKTTTRQSRSIAGNHNKSQQNEPQHTDNQYPETSPKTTTNNNPTQQNAVPPLKGAEGDVHSRTAINNNNLAKRSHEDNWKIKQDLNNSQQKTTNHSPLGGARGGFLFDPNTIDSISLRKLGLREKTTSIFLNWRRKGKRFYKKEELKKLYTLTPQEYQRLEPYIVIRNTLHAHSYSYEEDYGPLPQFVNINTADSITLIRLKGIGPVTAHRILERRRTNGGFKAIEEVLSVYHFPGSVKAYLKQKLTFK